MLGHPGLTATMRVECDSWETSVLLRRKGYGSSSVEQGGQLPGLQAQEWEEMLPPPVGSMRMSQGLLEPRGSRVKTGGAGTEQCRVRVQGRSGGHYAMSLTPIIMTFISYFPTNTRF